MAYTNPWSEITPTDNDQASTIDDLFRTGKLDLRERMDVLVEDWAADPVVPKQSAFGMKTKKLLIPGQAFSMDPAEVDVDINDSGVESSAGAGPLRAPLYLPPGVTITLIEFLLTNHGPQAVSIQLRSIAFTTGVTSEAEYSNTTSNADTEILSSGPLAISISDDKAYYLKIDKSSGGDEVSVHAVRITYDCPDSGATV